MTLYDGDQHSSFRFEPESPSGIGALLFHGFTGTPSEMRPLGQALAEAGITAICPLQPGFGINIGQLGANHASNWIEAALQSWDAVDAEFARTVLIGFSMGGSIALNVAGKRSPDRLILLAPFWKMAEKWAGMLPLMQKVKTTWAPYEDASFDDPAVRDDFLAIDPTLDLDDPTVQQRLREETVIPTSGLVELQKVGKAGGDAAKTVQAPTLVIQGHDDVPVQPDFTRELIKRLPGVVSLLEVAGDHQLVRPNRPTWPEVREAVVHFALSRSDT